MQICIKYVFLVKTFVWEMMLKMLSAQRGGVKNGVSRCLSVILLVTCCRMGSVLTQNITVSSTIRLCKQVWQMVRQVWPWNKISNSMFVWWRCNIPSIRLWAMWLKMSLHSLQNFKNAVNWNCMVVSWRYVMYLRNSLVSPNTRLCFYFSLHLSEH